MSIFELLNDSDFNEIIDVSKNMKININKLENDYKNCEDCDIQMQPNINNTLTCPKCGYIKKVIVENLEYEPSMSGYNINNNYYLPIKCVGKNSFQYQKYLRNNTSQYNIIQESVIRKKLENLNYESSDFIIPKNIINIVIDQYKKIREVSKIHRGEILNGILAALTYYVFIGEKIFRKPKEVSKKFRITENNFSKGDKILKELEQQKIIKLPVSHEYSNENILSYLNRINIDLKYYNFLLDLLDKIDNENIGNTNARLSTKVVALIFLLTISENIPITPEEISNEFKISISTYKTFYSDIFKNKDKVNDIFIKYNIKLPDKIPRKPRKPRKNE